MTTIYCSIVIYNEYIKDAAAFKNIILSDLPFCRILVTDNSEIEEIKIANKKECENTGAIYIDMGGDMGLSKAFNRAINETINYAENDDIIVFMNDDSDVTDVFLRRLEIEAEQYKEIDVFAPIMQGQNGVLYSPARQGFFKNHYPKTIEEEIPQKSFFAIASCCSVRYRVFENYRFDENIFMDVIDNDFCYEQRALGRKFKKINIVIHQNYALKNKNLTYKKIQGRLRIMLPDLWVFCKKKFARRIGYLPDVAARGIMYSYQCKNPKLWFWMIGYALKCMQK